MTHFDPLATGRRGMHMLLLLGLLSSTLSGCRSLPQAIRVGELDWPEGWLPRDHFLGPGVQVLATNSRDAARGIARYERMLEDLKPAIDVLPPPGVLFILGEDDESAEEEFELLFTELLQLAETNAGSPARGTAWAAFKSEGPNPAPIADKMRMVAFPLDAPRLIELLGWRPAADVQWALTLPTRASARSALGHMLAIRMKEEGANLLQRTLAPFALGFVMDDMRRETCTRLLVEVAYPDLPEEKKREILNGR